MVIVRLWGGLGNQMFQYACGYAIAKKNNTELVLDTRFYTDEYLKRNPHFSKQLPNILKFPLEYASVINEDNELKIIGILQNRTISRIIRIPARFNIKVDKGLLYCKETRLSFLEYVSDMQCKNIYLDGYWQCEQYFQEYKKEIQNQYTRKSEKVFQVASELGVLQENAVAIHVRLGDYYSGKKKFARCNSIINPEYYIKAIKDMSIKIKNPKLYVFSNDISKARMLLKEYDCVFVNEKRELSDLDEFEVMSLCTNHIISNSTFSWWAAWLSQGGCKIAPDSFVGNDSILPDDWIKIKVEV